MYSSSDCKLIGSADIAESSPILKVWYILVVFYLSLERKSKLTLTVKSITNKYLLVLGLMVGISAFLHLLICAGVGGGGKFCNVS